MSHTTAAIIGISGVVLYTLLVVSYVFFCLTASLVIKEFNRINLTKHKSWVIWFSIIPFISIIIQYLYLIRSIAKPIKSLKNSSQFSATTKLIYAYFVLHIVVLISGFLPIDSKIYNGVQICLSIVYLVIYITLIFKFNNLFKTLKSE